MIFLAPGLWSCKDFFFFFKWSDFSWVGQVFSGIQSYYLYPASQHVLQSRGLCGSKQTEPMFKDGRKEARFGSLTSWAPFQTGQPSSHEAKGKCIYSGAFHSQLAIFFPGAHLKSRKRELCKHQAECTKGKRWYFQADTTNSYILLQHLPTWVPFES